MITGDQLLVRVDWGTLIALGDHLGFVFAYGN